MPAATQLPAKPISPAPARASRWVGVWGWISREIASTPATQAEMKIAATTNRPAQRSARAERSRKAMPSGIAVPASPKLWIRSASRATLPLAMKIAVWAAAASASTTSERPTASSPSRERLMLSSTRPWEWPCAVVMIVAMVVWVLGLVDVRPGVGVLVDGVSVAMAVAGERLVAESVSGHLDRG